MPLYDLKNTETGEEWEEFMSYDSMKNLLSENPHIITIYKSMNIVGGTGDRVRVDGGMNDLLGRIARANPTSPLADRYGDKSTKAVKTREAVKKNQAKHGVSTITS